MPRPMALLSSLYSGVAMYACLLMCTHVHVHVCTQSRASCVCVHTIEGTQSVVTLRIDCTGSLWFNEGGRNLAKYNVRASSPTRTVVVNQAWLEESSRCLKSDKSCRIEGFWINTQESISTTLVFTYDRAYGYSATNDTNKMASQAATFNSIWKMNLDGTGREEVYKTIYYEVQYMGQVSTLVKCGVV